MASRIRRKPQVTYKSPSAEDPMYISSSLNSSGQLLSTSSNHRNTTNSTDIQHQKCTLRSANRHRYFPTPSLPLFHPLGRLALSLPPLDPARYGLPTLHVPDEIETKSSHMRKPTEKVHEGEEEPLTTSEAADSGTVAVTQEVKERPSPRKRRTGGAKRKRKDPDDGDATYPAKRTRMPRGAAGQGNDDDSVVDGPQPDEVEPAGEASPDLSDSAKRRSTRAKESHKQRDSSASETTSISGAANVTSGNAGPPDPISPADTHTVQKSDGIVVDQVSVNDDLKEEGELSEEQPGTS